MNATRAVTVRWPRRRAAPLGRPRADADARNARRARRRPSTRSCPRRTSRSTRAFGVDGRGTYTGTWFDAAKEDRPDERERADEVARRRPPAPSPLESVKRPTTSAAPPLLYDLTELQRTATAASAFTATDAARWPSALYEAAQARLTYPRTDSRHLPADRSAPKGIARSLAGVPRCARPRSTSPASTAARSHGSSTTPRSTTTTPSSPPASPAPGSCEGDDARIFDLVVRRFLAVFHPEAKFEDTEIVTVVADHRFRTRGRRLVEAGWRGAAFGEEAAAEEPQGDDDEPRQVLPQGRPGRARHLRAGRRAREADQAARPLLRGVAPARHGDRPARRSRTRSCATR